MEWWEVCITLANTWATTQYHPWTTGSIQTKLLVPVPVHTPQFQQQALEVVQPPRVHQHQSLLLPLQPHHPLLHPQVPLGQVPGTSGAAGQAVWIRFKVGQTVNFAPMNVLWASVGKSTHTGLHPLQLVATISPWVSLSNSIRHLTAQPRAVPPPQWNKQRTSVLCRQFCQSRW
jgi:hypothetical protein